MIGGLSWKIVFRPLSLALIGLAVAVTLWGFGYKLSLYSNSSDPLPRLPEAKVWIEHRYGYAVEFKIAATDEKPRSNLDFGPQILPAPLHPLLFASRRALFALPAQKRATRFYRPSLSPRSPPSLG